MIFREGKSIRSGRGGRFLYGVRKYVRDSHGEE